MKKMSTELKIPLFISAELGLLLIASTSVYAPVRKFGIYTALVLMGLTIALGIYEMYRGRRNRDLNPK